MDPVTSTSASSPAAQANPRTPVAVAAAATTAAPVAAASGPISPGQRFKATVADSSFKGVLVGVRFEGGVGYLDNPHAAFALRQYGALVEDRVPPVQDNASKV